VDKWTSAVRQGDMANTEWVREVVGVDSKERQIDSQLFRVVEWGGMEVV
jgi:hypothetical protein